MLTNKIFNASALESITFRVREYSFFCFVTRLGRPAEPSQQICLLQSAPLLSLVAIR